MTGSDLCFKRIILAPVLKSVEDKGRSHEAMQGVSVTQVRDEDGLGHGSCWSGDEKWWDIYMDRCDFPVCFPGSMGNWDLLIWVLDS